MKGCPSSRNRLFSEEPDCRRFLTPSFRHSLRSPKLMSFWNSEPLANERCNGAWSFDAMETQAMYIVQGDSDFSWTTSRSNFLFGRIPLQCLEFFIKPSIIPITEACHTLWDNVIIFQYCGYIYILWSSIEKMNPVSRG